MTLVPVYRRRASPLHSARAGIATLYCASLSLAALLYPHPAVLAAVAVAVLAAGGAAGVGRAMLRSMRLVVPFALLIVLINVLVSQRGLTVVFRGGTLLGHRFDVTAESLAWGGANALRFTVLVLAFGALFSAIVDPDELLRLMRRVSYRSALTASLTTRLVPVLARDATRMGDAARCRPHAPGRLEVTRAALTGALERAVEVAAALELRGYASARPPRRASRPWSRHDWSVATAALAVAAVAVAGRVAGLAEASFEPTVTLKLGSAEVALCLAIVGAALLPFAAPRARLGVARG
jgi:energy-coupling factor transport system permease protein